MIAKMSRRPTIWSAVERGGRVRAKVVKSRGTLDVEQAIYTHVLPSSMIFTDEWKGYTHRIASGHGTRDTAAFGMRTASTSRGPSTPQTVEGFFGLLKNGIRGVYHSVSSRHLQSYLDEYAWRYNHRHDSRPMFWTILDQVEKVEASAS